MNTTQRFPRPKPRFAGATEFVVIGVEAVVRGLSEGEIGMVVGGVLLLLAVVLAGAAWRRWGRRWRLCRRAFPLHGEEEEGVEMASMSADPPRSPSPSVL